MLLKFNKHIFKLLGGFSVIGLITTLLSLLMIFVFLKIVQTPLIITYVCIYTASILLSFILNSVFVFKSNISVKNGLKYFLIYFSGMLLGTLLLWVFKKIIPLENYILGYLVLPFTMVWNFSFSFILLKPEKSC
jgi:putative flippase GtrA